MTDPHRGFVPLSEEKIAEIVRPLFADNTVTDEDFAIVAAIEKEVWNRAMDVAADWLKWYDCQATTRREEYIRSLKVAV